MDDAGIDVSILSYPTPNAEGLEPSLAKELTRQANDTLAGAVSKHPDRFVGFATLPRLSPRARTHRTRPGLCGRNDKWPRQRALP